MTPLKIAGFLVTATVLLLTGCNRRPKTTSDLLTLMRNQAHQGRYDDAIREAMEWERRYPEDTSGNGFLNQQIAFLYLQKARDNRMDRDALVQEAIAYSNKGLAMQPQPDMTNAALAAEVFNSAGDLSPAARCDSYRRSVVLLESVIGREQDSKLQASRIHDQEALARMREKLSACERGPASQ